MADPVTGPFFKSYSGPGRSHGITWYRQKKPYNLQLFLENLDVYGKLSTNGAAPIPYDPTGRPTWLSLETDDKNLGAKAYAVAFDRFASKAKGNVQASLGMMLVEAGESVAMIANRLLAMTRFVKALKRGRFGEAYEALVDNNRTFKQQARLKRHMGTRRYQALPWSDALLEVSFGWAPIVQDIYNAADVLQKPPLSIGKPDRVHGTGWGEFALSGRRVETADWIETDSQLVRYGVRVSGRLDVSNPNLALANQLGLVNPVAVAWDAIPLSYLINWFIPLKQYLESYTTFWGYSLTDGSFSVKANGWSSKTSIHKPSGLHQEYSDFGYRIARRAFGSPPMPTLLGRVKLPGVTGALGKTATTCAVLIQQLSNRKR